jgi:co-chaperonin GroES (HSP10)
MSEVKCKLQFNHILVTLDTVGGTESKIILSDSDKKKTLKTDQKVLAVGPNATGIKIGDTVFLDTDRLSATQVSGKSIHIRHIGYDKKTGKILTDTNEKEFKDEDLEFAGLITDREVLMIIE